MTLALYCLAAASALVDVAARIPHIILDIRYASPSNFAHQKLYEEPVCLLQLETSERLQAVVRDLAPAGLQLKVFDCYRPLSVQRRMWELVPDTRYVANPATGSRHNRGTAVDLTLVDAHGKELPMGSAYDDFTERAHANYQDLTAKEKRNRQLLRSSMMRRGFLPLSTEWWHFDDPHWASYPLSDVPLPAARRLRD